MARLVFTNPSITINSVDLTDRIAQVGLDMSFAEVPTTAFGDTAVTRVAGLGDHSVSISFHQDFAAGFCHCRYSIRYERDTAFAGKRLLGNAYNDRLTLFSHGNRGLLSSLP